MKLPKKEHKEGARSVGIDPARRENAEYRHYLTETVRQVSNDEIPVLMARNDSIEADIERYEGIVSFIDKKGWGQVYSVVLSSGCPKNIGV